MKVIRYSFDGFKVQKQDYHLKTQIDFHLKDFDAWFEKEKIKENYPHLYRNILEKHEFLVKFYSENYEDFKEGIWVFWDGYKNSQSLNHLKKKTPCFSAILPDDIEVYDVNLEEKLTLSDPKCSIFGCFVPKRSLSSLKDVKRVS